MKQVFYSLIAATVFMLISVTPWAETSPTKSYRFDFEDGLPEALNLTNVELTTAPEEVISGSASLKCDTRDLEPGWNEFLHTAPDKVFLRPYHRYLLTFDYRVIEPGLNQFYYLLRSADPEAVGLGFDQMYWFNQDEEGEGTIVREFELGGVRDMYLIIGINREGVLVVDNVVLNDLGNPADMKVEPIKTGGTAPYADTLAWITEQQEQFGTVDRMRRMVVVLCNEGAGAKADPEVIVPDLDPDYINWNPIGPLGAKYGIRTSASRMEYQEYYRVEGPQYWDDRYELFTGSGFLATLDNDVHKDETWGEGGYSMCQNGCNWNRIFRENLLLSLDVYEDICQDNLTWSNFNMHAGFCPCCEQKFRQYLETRYPSGIPESWGIDTLDTFSIRQYIINHPDKRGTEALKDPIVREFIKFQNQSQLGAWCEHVEACKRRGLELGRDVAVYGNQTGIDIYPYGVALSVFGDAIEVEAFVYPYHYLLGRGSGNEKKAVFVRGGMTRHDRPILDVDFWKSRFGLGLTFGGQRVISLGWNHPLTSDPEIPDYIDDPDLYAFFKDYARFLREHRVLYGPQRCLTRTAIVWSFPTQMWRSFMPLDLYPHAQRAEFQRVGDWLLNHHLPFDVLVFGHPEMWDDSETLNRLDEYNDLLVPGVDCLSDTQITALKKWTQVPGNRLWATKGFGSRDENFNNRSEGWRLYDGGNCTGYRELVLDKNFEQLLLERTPFRVNAPNNIWVNVFRDIDTRWLTFHLFNQQEEQMEPGPDLPVVEIELELPSGVAPQATSVSYEQDEARELAVVASGDNSIRFRVPACRHYTMVVVGDSKVIATAQKEAVQWLQADRERVKTLKTQER